MKLICAECGTVKQDGPPPVSHGYCYGCLLAYEQLYDLVLTATDEEPEHVEHGGEGG